MKGKSEMTCTKIKELLIGYYEEYLSIEEKKKVEDHLRICEGCREELRQIESLFGILRQEKTEEVKPDFWTNFVPGVRERIARAPQPEFGFSLVPKLGPLFGFVTAVLIVGVILFSSDHRPSDRGVPQSKEAAYSLYQFQSTADQLAEAISLVEAGGLTGELISEDEKQSILALEELIEDQYWEKVGWEDLAEELSLEELSLLEEKVQNTPI